MERLTPDYKAIYTDILTKRYPDKINDCERILNKEELTSIDVIELNKQIFGANNKNESINQKHRSYHKKDILKILDHQKKHRLNNSQLANHFKLSRNTVAKWKKMFLA